MNLSVPRSDEQLTLMPCLRKTPSGGRMMARMRRTSVTVLSSAIIAAADAAIYRGGSEIDRRRHRRSSLCWARASGRDELRGTHGQNWDPFRSRSLLPLVFCVGCLPCVFDRLVHWLRRPATQPYSLYSSYTPFFFQKISNLRNGRLLPTAISLGFIKGETNVITK